MGIALKVKRKLILPALAAATFAALHGTPPARAAATFDISLVNAESNVPYDGENWDVWVVAATRTDTTGANAGIDGVDVTITSPAPLGIEFQKIQGAGINTEYSADVDGGLLLNTGVNAALNNGPAPAAFGDIAGGTFIGLGQGPYLADYANNPQITQAGASGPGAGVNGLVFANNDIGTANTDTYLNAYLPPHMTGAAGATLSSAFVNSGAPVSGSINNGNVTSLELIATEPDPGVEADAANGPIPFANIVVPTGTIFTVQGSIGPSGDSPAVLFNLTLGATNIPEPSAATAFILSAASLLLRLPRSRKSTPSHLSVLKP